MTHPQKCPSRGFCWDEPGNVHCHAAQNHETCPGPRGYISPELDNTGTLSTFQAERYSNGHVKDQK
jgi:hypothetical protein